MKQANLLLNKGQCWFVCMCVLYRNPTRWTDCDEIWHGGGPRGQEGSWFFLTQYPPPGYGVRKEGQGCLAIPTYFIHQTKFKTKYSF